MIDLPEDVILTLFEKLDIDTFLAMRLSCRRYHSLINSHIIGLTDAVAHATFPHQRQNFAECTRTDTSVSSCLAWLHDLQLDQLASIMCEYREKVMAEDPQGLGLRKMRVVGWKVLVQLSRIYEDVRHLSQQDLPQNHGIDRSEDLEALYELEICRRRYLYLETLTFDQLRGYQSLWDALLMNVLGYAKASKKVPGQLKWSTVWWMMGIIRRIGPKLFWQTWWLDKDRDPGNGLRLKHFLEKSWLLRDEVEASFLSDGLIALWNSVAVERFRTHKIEVVESYGERSQMAREMLRGPFVQAIPNSQQHDLDDGRPVYPSIASDVSFEQKLSREVVGEEPCIRRRGWRSSGRYGHYTSREDFASPCPHDARLCTEVFRRFWHNSLHNMD